MGTVRVIMPEPEQVQNSIVLNAAPTMETFGCLALGPARSADGSFGICCFVFFQADCMWQLRDLII